VLSESGFIYDAEEVWTARNAVVVIYGRRTAVERTAGSSQVVLARRRKCGD
jgi:hypothetical protein